jgi:hypothetical protein
MTVSGILRPKGVCGLQIDRKFELFFAARRMGGAKRYPSIQFITLMGFARGSTHPGCWTLSEAANPSQLRFALFAIP